MANLSDIIKDFGTFSGNAGASGTQGVQGIQGASEVAGAGGPLLVNTRSGSYTLVSGDLGKIVCGASAVTIPQNVFSVGSVVSVASTTDSTVTISPGSGVTLYESEVGSTSSLTVPAKSYCSIVCVSNNVFTLSGYFV